MTKIFSDIPLWGLIFWAAFSVLLALLLYRKRSWVNEIPNWRRILLISLRSFGLFLLGLFLFGILIKGIEKDVENPLVITVIDNSQSMKNYADSATVEQLTQSFFNATQETFNQKFNSLFYTLDDQLNDSDSLEFDSKSTNLSKALDKIYDNYYGRNIGAIMLLSDGNFNVGTSPLMVAEKFKRTPFYTLSVGDTIQKVDHLIKSIIVNDIAFLNNKFPVEITIEGNRTPNETFEIQLYENGKLIDSKNTSHKDSEYSLIKADFLLEARTVGVQEYNVKISTLDNEFNFENNEKSFFIEVLDDRSKVLLVTEALNPDAGAVRSALMAENNLEAISFEINNLPESLKEFDLIIWFDPGVSRDQAALKKIREANKPVWYFITPQTSNESISQLQIQANYQRSGQYDNIGAAFNQNFNLFKLASETRKAIDNFPPIRSNYGTLRYNQHSSILAYQKVGSITKQDPLIYFGSNQNLKFAVTYGTGIWGWRTADFQMNKSHAAFDEIIQKTVQYLILKENTSRLRITLPTIANNDEDVIINASFYNESYEPITNPTINLELSSPNGEKFNYSFLPLENEYSLNLGRLSVGKYSWRASTEYNGKSYAKEGTFAIKDLELEKQNTKANHQLLQQIAQNNDGKFVMLEDYSEVLNDILERDDIVPIAYETSSYHKLIDYFWLLLLTVLCFAAEWGLRRYSGSY